MNYINSNSEFAQISASKFLLFIIIITLFIAFFETQHDIFYSTKNQGYIITEATVISDGTGDKQRMYFFLFLFSAIIFAKGKGFSLIIRDALGWLILANLSWAMVSFLWADDPALTGRRIVLLFILNFTALSISLNVPLRQLPTIVFWITGPILAIGYFSERALGTWWRGSEGWRFSGTQTPEGQAMNSAMLFLAAAAMARKGGRLSRLMVLGVMVFAAIFLVLTRSRGPFVGAIIALGIYGLCTTKRSTFVTYMCAILVILGIMAIVFGDALFPLLNSGINLGRKDDYGGQGSVGGLSGRVQLWQHLGGFVKERPILGYGFGGFWTEDRIIAVADTLRWRITDGHSVYVDTVLGLGLIGLVILLSMLIVACRKGWRTCVNGGDDGGAFALSLLSLWIADGIWSSFGLGNGSPIFWLFIVLFGISREYQLQQSQRAVANDG